MNATSFDNNEEIGAVIYRVLRHEVRAERAILLGSDPELPAYPEIWSGFLKAAEADQLKIDVFFQRENLSIPAVTGGWESVTYTSAQAESGELMEQIKSRLVAGHLVIVYGATREISHLLRNSISHALETVLQHPLLSISTLYLSLAPDQMDGLKAKCLEPLSDQPDARMDCAELRVAQTLHRKNLEKHPIWAVMERDGLKEYLVFIHR